MRQDEKCEPNWLANKRSMSVIILVTLVPSEKAVGSTCQPISDRARPYDDEYSLFLACTLEETESNRTEMVNTQNTGDQSNRKGTYLGHLLKFLKSLFETKDIQHLRAMVSQARDTPTELQMVHTR